MKARASSPMLASPCARRARLYTTAARRCYRRRHAARTVAPFLGASLPGNPRIGRASDHARDQARARAVRRAPARVDRRRMVQLMAGEGAIGALIVDHPLCLACIVAKANAALTGVNDALTLISKV